MLSAVPVVISIVLILNEVDCWPEISKIESKIHVDFLSTDRRTIYSDSLKDIFDQETVKDVIFMFDSYHYLDYIYAKVEGEIAAVSIGYQSSRMDRRTFCQKSAASRYDCRAACNSITFLNVTAKIITIAFYGYATNIYNYLGCFEIESFINRKFLPNVESCEVTCPTFFYALNMEEKCICLKRTPRVSSVQLDLCKECANRRFIFCGGADHIAVYSKNTTQDIPDYEYDNFRDCPRYGSGCPGCDRGRVGRFCNHIDCDENRGNCGVKECRFLGVTANNDDMKIGSCFCRPGYYQDKHLECQDVDECDEYEPCEYFNGTCNNTVGSFICGCGDGWYHGDGLGCEDIDECNETRECNSQNITGCQLNIVCAPETSTCVNLLGDYECTCKEGFAKRNAARHSSCDVATVSITEKIKYFLYVAFFAFLIILFFFIMVQLFIAR